MTWEDKLRSTAGELGRRLEERHPKPPARRRVRLIPWAAAAFLAAIAVWAVRPADPVAAIEAQYAGQMADVRIDDAGFRREFEAAMAHVERAIALAKDAVRRSPGNEEFVRLCHLAHQAKVRLIQAYTRGG